MVIGPRGAVCRLLSIGRSLIDLGSEQDNAETQAVTDRGRAGQSVQPVLRGHVERATPPTRTIAEAIGKWQLLAEVVAGQRVSVFGQRGQPTNVDRNAEQRGLHARVRSWVAATFWRSNGRLSRRRPTSKLWVVV